MTNRPPACRVCGAPVWTEGEEWLDRLSGWFIGMAECLRCGAAYIYRRASGAVREDRDE